MTGGLIRVTLSDMNKRTRRPYISPLREALALDTRKRILETVADLMRSGAPGPLTIDAVARRAGIERRTVFRHFSTRDALLAAFWVWINERHFTDSLPSTLDELTTAPPRVFEQFDTEEGIVRGSLHSEAGRAMRLGAVAARRVAFRKAVREVGIEADAVVVRRFELISHALFSAAAWETMRDYADVGGREAGDAVSWALTVLANAARATKPKRR